MSEYHLFSSSKNVSNAPKNKEHANKLLYQKHSFSTHQGAQLYQTAFSNESQSWSNTNGNTIQTSLDSILNHVPDFHHNSRHVQSTATTDNVDFNPFFDFLPSFGDHLIVSHQPSTKNSSAIKATDTVQLNTNSNNQGIYIFDHDHIGEKSILPYFDGIQEPQQYTTNQETSTSEQRLSLHIHKKVKTSSTKYSGLQSSVNDTLSRMIRTDSRLESALRRYLCAENPIQAGEKTILVMTSKVAQKSYGTERRFLCPPPTVILVGSSWWTIPSKKKLLRDDAVFCEKQRMPPLLNICISGGSSDEQSGRIEWYGLSGTMVGQTGGSKERAFSKTKNANLVSLENKANINGDWYQNSRKEVLDGGRCILKRLYINDVDKKKVECLIKIQLANGFMLRTILSEAIKVISKPSKKRQSIKNLELCIYHGATVSLFNRIRSQTISTKYLGASSDASKPPVFEYPGRNQNQSKQHPNGDTCFVARTNYWDPFVIWLVDPSQPVSSGETSNSPGANVYIGTSSVLPTISYPNPPTIAMKNRTNQPLAIRYNQHIVLQCLSTGLVSPVMIVRKVDKASTVVGGARSLSKFDLSSSGGGECGDEVLGDPVSQLNKIALQIVSQNYDSRYTSNNNTNRSSSNMMPQMTDGAVTYLACLNDFVGTYKTTIQRGPIRSVNCVVNQVPAAVATKSFAFTASALSATLNTFSNKKRHIESSMEAEVKMYISDTQLTHANSSTISNSNVNRRRVSSLNDRQNKYRSILQTNQQDTQRSNSVSNHLVMDKRTMETTPVFRRSNEFENSGQTLAELGEYWSEDVTDSAVWTIVGTECAKYTFWAPPYLEEDRQIIPLNGTHFPRLTHFVISNQGLNNSSYSNDEDQFYSMTISGENFTHDLQVWFGDIKAPLTEFKSHELLICRLPPHKKLMQSAGLNRFQDADRQNDEEAQKNKLPFRIVILLVQEDGVVYKTNKSYYFR